MDNCHVLLFDIATLPKFAELDRTFEPLAHDHYAASFAIKPIDHMWGQFTPEIKTHPADQARVFVALGRMTNKAGRFIDDHEVIVLGDDLKKLLHQPGF